MDTRSNPISSSFFHYLKPNKHRDGHKGSIFVAEISTLNANKFAIDTFGAFLMKSEKTGEVVRFVYVDKMVSNDSDCETEGWVYIVDHRDVAKNLALADIHVHILND